MAAFGSRLGVLYEWGNDVSRGRPLDRKRENNESDTLNADSAKRSDERVGIHRGEAGSARRKIRENERARDGNRAEGKDQ